MVQVLPITLLQQSLDTGEISKEWSLANIYPLYKNGDRALHVTIASSLCLVYLASYLNAYCDQISWPIWMNINFFQTGDMRSEKGTVVKLSRLSTVINEWAKILDDGGQVDTLKKTQFSFLLSEDQIYFDFPNLTDQQRKNQKTS